MPNQKPQISVLIADDEDIYLMIGRRHLEADGYKVFTADKGTDAFDIAKKEKPDIILSDIFMPGMDGFELAKKIKSDDETKNIKIVLMTQYANKEGRDKADDLGVTYIQKQDHIDLTSKVKEYLVLDGEEKNKN